MADGGSRSPEADRLIAIIGDEDTVTGFLLTGIGDRSTREPTYFVVRRDTTDAAIAQVFEHFTVRREDVGMVLITQNVANRIRGSIEAYEGRVPAVIEIPSKDQVYDPRQDTLMQRVQRLLGIRER
jgi:V-type H+-transporting ATPase subunit F